MAFDLASLGPFFKTIAADGLIQALSLQGSPFRAMLRTEDSYGGAGVKEVPLQYALPQARSRTAATALAGRTTAAPRLAQWTVKNGQDIAAFQIPYQDILKARTDEMAFGRLQQVAVTSTLASLNDSINRSLFRGGVGDLAKVASLATTTITNDTAVLANAADATLFEISMNCQYYNVVGANNVATLLGAGEVHTVVAVDAELGRVQFDFNLANVGGGGVVAGTTIIQQGDAVGYSSSIENGAIVGLATYLPLTAPVVADPDLWGQPRWAYPVKLAGHRKDATNLILWDEIQRMVARIMRFKGRPTHAFMAPEQLQNMIIGRDGMTQNIRETVRVLGDFGDGDGVQRYQEIGFSGVRILTPNGALDCYGDPFCPPDRVFVLSMDSWVLLTMGAFPHLIDFGNVNGLMQAENDLSVQGRFFAGGQLVCTAPAYNGVLKVTPVY